MFVIVHHRKGKARGDIARSRAENSGAAEAARLATLHRPGARELSTLVRLDEADASGCRSRFQVHLTNRNKCWENQGLSFGEGSLQMWNNIGELRNLSSWLQWISISLVFFSGFLQVGKYVIDRRERELSTIEQANRSNPTRELIRAGTATIEVTVESPDQASSHFTDSGAYMAFGRAGDTMLVMRSLDCFGIQNGKGEVVWRAVLSLDANDPSVGKEIHFLQEAEVLELGFAPMPAKSLIKGGLVIITLNSAVRLELSIPAQTMEENRISVPNLTVVKSQLE